MFTPIDKPWPFARRAGFVFQIAGLVCLGASQLLVGRLLDLVLSLVSIVFFIAALFCWVRWRKSDRATRS